MTATGRGPSGRFWACRACCPDAGSLSTDAPVEKWPRCSACGEPTISAAPFGWTPSVAPPTPGTRRVVVELKSGETLRLDVADEFVRRGRLELLPPGESVRVAVCDTGIRVNGAPVFAQR